jgi:hypothetical protein
MTGEKDRYKTQEKLWKLDDEQLSTPKHDEMVLQLLNLDYCKKLFTELNTEPEYVYSGKEFVISPFFIKNINAPKDIFWIEQNKKEIIQEKHWDIYFRGFPYLVDLYDVVGAEYQSIIEPREITICAESPIVSNNYIIGYWDVVIHKPIIVPRNFELKNNPILGIFIEVKPKIDSFGKVLRQLKTYMQYLKGRESIKCCLYTPDTQYDAAFEGQGIHVVHPLP